VRPEATKGTQTEKVWEGLKHRGERRKIGITKLLVSDPVQLFTVPEIAVVASYIIGGDSGDLVALPSYIRHQIKLRAICVGESIPGVAWKEFNVVWPTLSKEREELVKEPRRCNNRWASIEALPVKTELSRPSTWIGTCLKDVHLTSE
jgi:hypothetical protein